MKNIAILVTAATFAFAGPSLSQLVEADGDAVESLRQLVLSEGFKCASVTDMQPNGATGVLLTCKKRANGNASSVFIIEVSDSGLSVTKQ